MKSIILGVATAIVSVAALAAPANAIGVSGAGSIAMTHNGYVKMGIGPNGPFFQGESVYCTSSAGVFNTNFHEAKPVDQSVVQQTPKKDCSPTQAVQTPPANTTVTINGVCGDPAELAKITQANKNIIINSVGKCEDQKPQTTPQPATVNVTPVVKTASATVATPEAAAPAAVAELPQTGSALFPIVAAALAAASYGGALVIRSLRRA